MAVLGLNHYNLRAPRELLERLRAFYCDVIGLTEGERPAFNRFGYWLYADGHDVLHLLEASPDEIRATGTVTTFDHAAFTCTNYAAMEKKLLQHQINYQTRFIAQTGTKQIFFQDPAGNGVELNFSAK